MIRKAALQIGVPALLAFMAWNAYLAVNHLEQMQKIAALTVESSKIQADISGVLKDLTDMETGQRGYLLTNDSSYLQPYSDAKGRIETDFASLRAGLASRSSANDHWNRRWSLWLTQSKLRWNALLVCANRGIATAHSCWWIQTKVWSTWRELAGFCLRYPWRRPATSRDSTSRGMLI